MRPKARAGLRACVAAAAWLPAAAAAAFAPAQVSDLLEERVPALLGELDVPGAAVVVVQPDRVLALRGYGTVDPGAGTAVDPARHVFRIGSLSKALTASTVLLAMREAGIGRRDDLRALLTALPIRPPLERPLTMHHLLTHTAGFNERLFGQHVATPSELSNLTDYLEAHLPPRFDIPGKVISYNDHHTVLAAWIAERTTGEEFPALAERLLLGPLGMSATTFWQSMNLPAAVEAGLVRAWRRSDGRWWSYPRDYVITAPAAGAYASAADMGRYLQALLRCDGRPIDAELCAVQLARQAAHHARLPGRAYGFAEARHGESRVRYKDGQASGFNARLLLVPEHGLGMFVVHNRNILGTLGGSTPAGRFNREVTAMLLDRLLPGQAEAPAVPLAAEGAAQRVQRYAGDYRNVVAARHTWERLIGMFDDVHVAATSRGVDLGHGEYVEVEPGLAQWHEGGDRYVAFRRSDRRASHLFIGGGAYERIPWYTASWFTPWFVAGTALWFLGWLLVGGCGLRGLDRWAAVLPAASFLGFLLAFGTAMGAVDVQVLFQGATPALLAALALPLVGAAALALQAVTVVTGWRHRQWPRRAAELVHFLFAGCFVWWLAYWNLLGYRLG